MYICTYVYVHTYMYVAVICNSRIHCRELRHVFFIADLVDFIQCHCQERLCLPCVLVLPKNCKFYYTFNMHTHLLDGSSFSNFERLKTHCR